MVLTQSLELSIIFLEEILLVLSLNSQAKKLILVAKQMIG